MLQSSGGSRAGLDSISWEGTLRQMGQRARRRLHRRQMLAWPQGMSATCTGRTCAQPQLLQKRGSNHPMTRLPNQRPSKQANTCKQEVKQRGMRELHCACEQRSQAERAH